MVLGRPTTPDPLPLLRLPPRSQREAPMRSLQGPLERICPVGLQDQETEEVEARSCAHSEHGHALAARAYEVEIDLVEVVECDAGVGKAEELRGQVRKIDDSEPLRSEERQANLEVHHAEPVTEEAVEPWARTLYGTLLEGRHRTFLRFEAPERVSTNERLVPQEVGLNGGRIPVNFQIFSIPPEMDGTSREGEGAADADVTPDIRDDGGERFRADGLPYLQPITSA